jgi:hypothetical protein
MKVASLSRIWLGSDLDNGRLPEVQTEVSGQHEIIVNGNFGSMRSA